jgi:hypothetical protein
MTWQVVGHTGFSAVGKLPLIHNIARARDLSGAIWIPAPPYQSKLR